MSYEKIFSAFEDKRKKLNDREMLKNELYRIQGHALKIIESLPTPEDVKSLIKDKYNITRIEEVRARNCLEFDSFLVQRLDDLTSKVAAADLVADKFLSQEVRNGSLVSPMFRSYSEEMKEDAKRVLSSVAGALGTLNTQKK